MSDNKENLAGETCIPCSVGAMPMPLADALKLVENLDKGWLVNSLGHLERVVLLKNFSQSVKLTVKIGEVADQQGHHPDLKVSYGKLVVEIWTHKIDGLTRSDFVLAAKIDKIIEEKTYA